MKHTTILLLFLCSCYCYGQPSVSKIESSKLPMQISYSGQLNHALKWKDSLGMNYVLMTETGEYAIRGEEEKGLRNAELYVYHYVQNGDSIKLSWRVYDYVKDCPFDVFVRFIDKACTVTDLDKNGIAEVWTMYEVQCTSDVSPAPTKIIMYEGNKKYAIRGENRVQYTQQDFMGGQYALDENFKDGNALFRQFAVTLWEKHGLRK